jgi:hypothetical protein
LYIHLREIGIAAGFEAERHRTGAAGLADRLHVDRPGDPLFALDNLMGMSSVSPAPDKLW